MSEQDPFIGNTPPSEEQVHSFFELIESLIPPESSVKFFNSARGKEYELCVERPNPKVKDSTPTIEFTETEVFKDYSKKTFTTFFLDENNIVQRRVLTTREKLRPIHLIAEADQFKARFRDAQVLFGGQVSNLDIIKTIISTRTPEEKARAQKSILEAVNLASTDHEETAPATAKQLADAMHDVASFLNNATAIE